MSAEFTINEEIQVDLKEYEVHHPKTGRTFTLGSNEAELLKFFFKNPNQVITRQALIEQVWESKGIYVEDGSLMQTISLCRKALEDKAGLLIVTERGKGYRFSGRVIEGKIAVVLDETPEAIDEPEQEETPKSTPLKLIPITLVLIMSTVLSYLGFTYFEKVSVSKLVTTTHYLTCRITSDHIKYKELYNVTMYQYENRNIIIDHTGKSLSFPNEFTGVECE
ncbi:winged helix-turn-helix domain-containing protein [Vibrio sp. D404a]|uniref:winged helix-turn-helix domain-containing protein n=1 Tax=unclassified Vibrio TaxID=2614977 RepID=UPI0025551268|nr:MULTISPECIES: winged helix-turn-helix domain-containing protein [unclassified Vibrio]MDK9738396.1 winged helix-turn-helix domain-containing protein [Vibrio sp. D404a]MDK9796240.1 winged helix-turn-helix domain-containing protein [Vibrio sp. D449a]